MATYRKVGGKVRAEIARMGVRKSATFPSKGAAVAWAGREEAAIIGGARGEIPNLTVDAILERYGRDVAPGKKGARWESVRITALRRDPLALARLRTFGKVEVAQWRDRRLKAVSAASVRREWNLLGRACNLAVNEWGWLKENPFGKVKRPADGKARKRIASDAEIAILKPAASESMRAVIVWALETGMRAGEIAALQTGDVSGHVAIVRDSKNDTSREVPLSKAALAVWTGGFGLTAGSISGLFARLCRECEIKGLTFHDLRRTAITRLAKKLDPFELAKMVGHKDLKITLNVYYQVDTGVIAKKLDP